MRYEDLNAKLKRFKAKGYNRIRKKGYEFLIPKQVEAKGVISLPYRGLYLYELIEQLETPHTVDLSKFSSLKEFLRLQFVRDNPHFLHIHEEASQDEEIYVSESWGTARQTVKNIVLEDLPKKRKTKITFDVKYDNIKLKSLYIDV